MTAILLSHKCQNHFLSLSRKALPNLFPKGHLGIRHLHLEIKRIENSYNVKVRYLHTLKSFIGIECKKEDNRFKILKF